MQNAETVLDVLRERGRRGLPCTELYRQLFNPGLYLMADGRLYSNHEAMTPGADGETADGISMGKIGRIIDAMRHERYRFLPARRVYIPKKQGTKMRPLGLPSWADKRENLKLGLSPDKTLVTHARTGAARFLGYEITVHHADHKLTNGRRSVNGKVALRVPRDVIAAKSAPFMKLGKPERRPDLLNLTDNQIIGKYGAEWRGYLQYHLLAQDVCRLNRLQWVMPTSMLKTLAGKHRSTVTAMARKHQATIATPHGPRVCFQASVERAGKPPLVARFGGIPLKRQKKAVLDDRRPAPVTGRRRGSELLARLRVGQCELCEQRAQMQVHQVSKPAHLIMPGRPQPPWTRQMATMRRKTLIVCPPCHDGIHNRQPANTLT
jgi:Type II intron maturase